MEIEAIMWYFGMTHREALEYYKLLTAQGNTASIYEIVKAYQNNAKLAFYND